MSAAVSSATDESAITPELYSRQGGWGVWKTMVHNKARIENERLRIQETVMAPEQQRRYRKNINESGHAHELTCSCYRRFPFLTRDRACQWLVDAIHKARHSLDFDVWA